MIFPAHVFKAYDIRGLALGELDATFARRLGEVFVGYTKAKTVVIGRDMRTSSPGFAAALIEGLTSQGANVVDLGLVSTPLFYFGVAAYEEHDAGIMVTASHNPATYNGFKLVGRGAVPIGGDELQKIRATMEMQTAGSTAIGNVSQRAILDDYLTKVLSLADTTRLQDLSVVVDTGNGMAAVTAPSLFQKVGACVTPLFWELDGTFLNHEANPAKTETLAALSKTVVATGAALGIAYDGDADRIGFVDEQGQPVASGIIGALLASEFLQANPGASILYDVSSSRIVPETIERVGGRPVMIRTGHSFIQQRMPEERALVGIELSGHYFIRDFWNAECPDLVALMIMGCVVRSGVPFSALVRPLDQFVHSGGNITFKMRDKDGALRALRRVYGNRGHATTIDGLRVDFPDWWFLARPSNTEPVLRLIVEAKTKALLEERVCDLTAIIEGGKAE